VLLRYALLGQWALLVLEWRVLSGMVGAVGAVGADVTVCAVGVGAVNFGVEAISSLVGVVAQ
jgi:hypothetical protein